MKAETLNALIEKLKAACAKEPTAAQVDVLKESIVDNRLTDEEIFRGYRLSRDAESPWWPKPGEFLSRARRVREVGSLEHRRELIENLLDTLEPHSPGWISTKAVLDRMNMPVRVH